MFDIGLLELLLLSIVVLLVVGPKRLPETLRTLGLWIGRMRRSCTRVKAEIEREIGMDDVRRQLHNESITKRPRETKDFLLFLIIYVCLHDANVCWEIL